MTSTVTTFLMLEFGIVANEIFVFANFKIFEFCLRNV